MTRLKYIFLSGPLALICYFLHDLYGSMFYEGYNWRAEAVGKVSATYVSVRYVTRPLLLTFHILAIFCMVLAIMYFRKRIDLLQWIGLMIYVGSLIVSLLSFAVFPMVDISVGSLVRNNLHMFMSKALFWMDVAAMCFTIWGGKRAWGDKKLANAAFVSLVFMLLAYILIVVCPESVFGILQRITKYASFVYVVFIGTYIFHKL